MPAFKRTRLIEYSILHDVEPAGANIGFYSGRPIYESVIDQFGRRFEFIGLASRRQNGQFDADALRTGEFFCSRDCGLRPRAAEESVTLRRSNDYAGSGLKGLSAALSIPNEPLKVQYGVMNYQSRNRPGCQSAGFCARRPRYRASHKSEALSALACRLSGCTLKPNSPLDAGSSH